jgi:predicted RNase H-like nuclease (RuvC/YqgF family)
MWDKLFEYGKQILSLTKRVDENTSDIKELRASLKELTSVVVNLANSNNELRILFEHLKETEGSERDKLTREWQIYQDNYQKDQEIVFLKLKNLIQEEKISRLSQKTDQPKLSGEDELGDVTFSKD